MEKFILEHLLIVTIVVLLTIPFKAAALWRAARRGHIGWFLTLIIINSLAILDILYIFVFSNFGTKKKEDVQDEESVIVRQPRFSQGVKNRQTIV
ncbi:MAG: DUF5652 family protein [bacterium]